MSFRRYMLSYRATELPNCTGCSLDMPPEVFGIFKSLVRPKSLRALSAGPIRNFLITFLMVLISPSSLAQRVYRACFAALRDGTVHPCSK